MIKCQIYFGVLIASAVLLTALKKESHVTTSNDPIKINIADAMVVQGDKGQKTVEVMVLLSRASAEPVTVKYDTKDKTAKAGVDYVAKSGSIKFEPGEVSKEIAISIIGEVAAEPDENAAIEVGIEFWVHLNAVVGAFIDKADAIINIIKNAPRDPLAKTDESVYEVAIEYTGFLSTYGPTNLCGARTNGSILLYGVLKGIEDLHADDDVVYTGTLNMMIRGMDLCSVTNLPNSDETKHCVIHVFGCGTVEAELEITYGTDRSGKKSEGRGGYLKMENKDGNFLRIVDSDECDAQQIDELWTKVPYEFFNYTTLPMIVTRTLQLGVLSVTDEVGNKTTINVLRKLR